MKKIFLLFLILLLILVIFIKGKKKVSPLPQQPVLRKMFEPKKIKKLPEAREKTNKIYLTYR